MKTKTKFFLSFVIGIILIFFTLHISFSTFLTQQQKDKRLFLAVKQESFMKTWWYLSIGADVNARDEVRNTPIIIASSRSYINIISILLYNGANINAQNIHGINAVMLATLKCNIDRKCGYDTIEFLINKGANPYLTDIDGNDTFSCIPEYAKDSLLLLLENTHF